MKKLTSHLSMFADLRGALTRAGRVFGVKSALIVAGFLVSQSLVSVVLDSMHAKFGTRGEIAWLVLTVVVAGIVFARWNQQMSADGPVAPVDSLGSRRGLVVLCGLDSDLPTSPVARLLREATSAEYLVLVGTPQTRDRRTAERVVDTIAPVAGRTFADGSVRILSDADALDVEAFRQATLDAIGWLRRMGVADTDILVDVTEGRRAMGFAAVSAAQGEHVDWQYLASAYDPSGVVRLDRAHWSVFTA